MAAIITLTTDFGLSDAYVGVMKGTILGINPDATIVDISHTIEPQNVAQAAYILSCAIPYFPKGTIHVIVVDPGVGTDRQAIILKTANALFVAPDNGVLTHASADMIQTVAITEPRFRLDPVSSTFQGRDVFAPASAHLSLGVPLEDFGKQVASPRLLPLPQAHFVSADAITGEVIHIDRFGNLITNLRAIDLPQTTIQIEIKGHHVHGLSSSYAYGNDQLLALIESNGYLEIALKNANAAAWLNARIGDPVRVKRVSILQLEAGSDDYGP